MWAVGLLRKGGSGEVLKLFNQFMSPGASRDSAKTKAMKGIIGKKVGMTSIFAEIGRAHV